MKTRGLDRGEAATSVREGRVAGEYGDGGGRLEGVEEKEDKDEE